MRRSNTKAALERGLGAADSDALVSAGHPHFTVKLEFCQHPPDDELKRQDYDAWCAARRRFLLRQASAYQAGEGF